MPRDDYAERQATRREQLKSKAYKLRQEAESRWKEADRMAQLMNGQPILIGHHSEKRHRRDIDRMHTHHRKGSEAYSAAKEAERKAAAVGTGGISSDDPEAVAQLKTKLAALERDRERAKAINAHWRKNKTMQGFPGISGDGAAKIDAEMARRSKPGNWVPDPHKVYPSYHFQNLGANIRRIKGRIEALETEAKREPAEDVTGNGWAITEDEGDNRIWVTFDEKPSRETCAMMRQNGFKWSRRRVAWIRQINTNGRAAAERVRQALS